MSPRGRFEAILGPHVDVFFGVQFGYKIGSKNTLFVYGFWASFWGPKCGPDRPRKLPRWPSNAQRSAEMSSKSLLHGSFSAQLKPYKQTYCKMVLAELSKSDSRNAQEPSCCHFEPPRSDKEDGMRRLRQRAPNRDRKKSKNEPQEGPRNESERGQNRGPKRGPEMACESLRAPTQLGPGPEGPRALILCNV